MPHMPYLLIIINIRVILEQERHFMAVSGSGRGRGYEVPDRPHIPIGRVLSSGGVLYRSNDDTFSSDIPPPPLPPRTINNNNRPLPPEPHRKRTDGMINN